MTEELQEEDRPRIPPYNIYDELEAGKPTEAEYMANFNLTERMGAMDCVNVDTAKEDVFLDAPPTREGLALKTFKKPFGHLTRTEQNMIMRTMQGHRMEIDARIKTLKKCTEIESHERIARMSTMMEKLHNIQEEVFVDFQSLTDDDNQETVYRNQRLSKSVAGKARARLKWFQRLQKVAKSTVEIEAAIQKVGEKASSTTFVKEGNDNRKIITTPDTVKEAFKGIVDVEESE